MLYIIIGLSFLLFALGFILTESNASFLLSGYNTMSKEEKQKVDLKSYLHFYKRFHVFLGISTILLGIFIYYLIGEDVAGVFLTLYPLLAYCYFIFKGKEFNKNPLDLKAKISIFVLLITILGVITLDYLGFKEDKITITKNEIRINGMYSEIIPISEIKTITLVDSLPKIRLRINGFSLGSIHKGYYKTVKGERVKLVLNSKQQPVILITKTNDKKIYYSAKSISNEQLYKQIHK